MTPMDFFKRAPIGSRVRYGEPNALPVKVTFIVQDRMYAYGVEEGTGRRVFLILEKDQLNDPNRGFFDSVEILG